MTTGTAARIDRGNLADHLRTLGYEPTPIANDTWRAHLKAAGRTFPLLVRTHEGYVTFAIVPLLKTPRTASTPPSSTTSSSASTTS
ncbi:MAG: hypothetical protein IPI43_08230 [Sandaracinaceae bacterium]|nr:hypothetical protein [Sandaracinaceae bacterium]